MEENKPSIIVILGPTGVGKSQLAMELAERLHGEIVNADSMQVYKGMDIGTAKPTIDERRQIPHHLIDIVYPNEPFDVSTFRDLGDKAIREIHQRKNTILVVGGTGLYIRVLTHGIFSCPKGKDSIRRDLKYAYQLYGGEYLYRQLKEKDPVSATKIHPHDVFRIIRALEVYELTGKPISQHQKEHGFQDGHYKVLKIGLNLDRLVLYSQIDKRCNLMVNKGFIEEVRELLNQDYHENLRPMKAIGYRHTVGYIKGIYDQDTAISLFKRDTRRYAKRQLTWFRKAKEISWFDPHYVRQIEERIREFLSG